MIRPGYAVEYDYVDPAAILPTFRLRAIDNLYLAGQINGTSGYEEAAGQGLLAGLNAARFAAGQDGVEFGRDSSYLGVLADDITTKEIVEPYRLFTSRAEHRLSLRQDNADFRLCEKARSLGLLPDEKYRAFKEYSALCDAVEARCKAHREHGRSLWDCLKDLQGSCDAAKPPFERPPVVFFHNGDISGYVGHDVRVTLRTALEKTGDALKFDGQRSVCRFSIPWLYPDRPLSASYVVDLTLDRLPEKSGVITGRPGFHNALAVRPDGRVTFSCFGRDGKTSRLLISRNPLIPGKRHRVAGTMDCSRDNHTAMKLYIDGALEAADTLPMPPRHYGRELFLGGIDADRNLLEDRSTSTEENMRYSLPMLRSPETDVESVGIVTNDFHVFRALCLARKNGGFTFYGVPARSTVFGFIHYAMREFFTLSVSLVRGYI